MFFGKKLRAAREKAKKIHPSYTQEYFGDLLGMGRENYNRLEAGVRSVPVDETLQKIADIPDIYVTFKQLKGWQAIDEYGEEVIFEAAIDLAGNDLLARLEAEKSKRLALK